QGLGTCPPAEDEQTVAPRVVDAGGILSRARARSRRGEQGPVGMSALLIGPEVTEERVGLVGAAKGDHAAATGVVQRHEVGGRDREGESVYVEPFAVDSEARCSGKAREDKRKGDAQPHSILPPDKEGRFQRGRCKESWGIGRQNRRSDGLARQSWRRRASRSRAMARMSASAVRGSSSTLCPSRARSTGSSAAWDLRSTNTTKRKPKRRS